MASWRPESLDAQKPESLNAQRLEFLVAPELHTLAEREPSMLAEGGPWMVAVWRPELLADWKPVEPSTEKESKSDLMAVWRPEVLSKRKPKFAAAWRPDELVVESSLLLNIEPAPEMYGRYLTIVRRRMPTMDPYCHWSSDLRCRSLMIGAMNQAPAIYITSCSPVMNAMNWSTSI